MANTVKHRLPEPDAPPASAPELEHVEAWFTPLPARPFAVAPTPSGEHAFVSLPRAGARGLVALSAGTPWRVERVLWVSDLEPRGLVADPTARHLLVADGGGGLAVVDVARLLAGDEEPFAAVVKTAGRGSMQVALHPEGRLAFVTDEASATLTVVDFGATLGTPAPVATDLGRVPLPPAPVGVACSPDGAHLFVTSQGERPGSGTLGILRVADVVDDPARARVAAVPAGTSPVRALVAAGHVWVTARGSNSLLGFDVASLVDGRERDALRAVVRVGASPVGIASVLGGSLLVVANSNRYEADAERPQTLAVIDAEAAALVGTIRAGAFPRDLATLPDDRTVLVANVFSQSLQAVRIDR